MEKEKVVESGNTNNDDLLRLYLGKAGLSDDLERYSTDQRKIYIYDIIKSNKMPGYWVPPTMRAGLTPPAVRPPPLTQRTPTSTPHFERKLPLATPQNSLTPSSTPGSSARSSPQMTPRFMRATETPPSPTSFVNNNKKGLRPEISGPINFQHLSGDMTRDMTRQAFDLTMSRQDNVLRKYMIERGIRDDDVSDYSKQELIRNIVQSKFTWMPPKRRYDDLNPMNIHYATISTNNEVSPPPSPQPSQTSFIYESEDSASPEPSSPAPSAKTDLSNFSLVASRFVDVAQFPRPESIYGNIKDSHNKRPALSTRKPPPLPPPKGLRRTPTILPSPPSTNFEFIQVVSTYPPPAPPQITKSRPEENNLYTTFTKSALPPLTAEPPKSNLSKFQNENNTFRSNTEKNSKKVSSERNLVLATPSTPPPPPPPPSILPAVNGSATPLPPPPPPPPPAPALSPAAKTTPTNNIAKNDDPKDALLQSIRNGVALKKVNLNGVKSSVREVKTSKKPTNDLLSELKFTLKRAKGTKSGALYNDEFDESNA